MRRVALSIALLTAVVSVVALAAPAARAAGAAAPAAGAAAPAAGTAALTQAASARFPERAYRLTVPARRGLRPQDLRVTENGEPVRRLSLVSADGARGRQFGAVLVIDASSSMRGRAIRNAVAAARDLAAQRRSAQRIGVVAFNGTPKVLLAPTDDPRAIAAALRGTPRLAPQTRIFDAVGAALDVLARARVSAGSIVVLSDGSDTGSRVSAQAIARRARAADVAIYTVGLRSGAFDSGELRHLAGAGGGRYVAAESVFDLRRIFRALGVQLASDYLLGYRSAARPGRQVTVAVRVRGVDAIATSAYEVPGGTTFVEVKRSIWTSAAGADIAAVLCAVLLAFGLAVLLVRRVRAPTLRERMRGFVSLPGDAAGAEEKALGARAAGAAVRSLERTRWWTAFKRDAAIAGIAAEPIQIVAAAAAATLVVAYALVSLTGIALVGLFALVVPWGARTWLRVRLERRRAQFTEQLPDMLQGTASAIRAGHGLVAALSMVAEEAAEPSRTEFLHVVADEALGVPLEEALRVVQRRMDSRDVLQIALVAQIQRESGGNMAEVLDRVVDALRQRGELRRMVSALTAQGRLSRWVVTALPLVLLLVVSVADPHYVNPLFTTSLGLTLLAMAGAMMAAGSLVIGKIVNFEV
jgi:tight adherence protein B